MNFRKRSSLRNFSTSLRSSILSCSQGVIVQDCSQTGNNDELKKRQRSRRKQQKKIKKVNADTRFRAKNLSRPHEEVKLRARQFSGRARAFQARVKLDTRVLISREDVSLTARDSDNIVLTKMISRETKMISRETRMISRETRMISR